MNKLIEIENLTVGYENKPNVLRDVSLTIYKDDFLGIIGPNGGGKTTLLKTILGLIRQQSGTISFYDNGKKVLSLNIGYRSEEHTSELQSRPHLVCRLLLE